MDKRLTDEDRESLIDIARHCMEQAPSRAIRLEWWTRMRRYIAERSPEQVRRMEQKQKLDHMMAPWRIK